MDRTAVGAVSGDVRRDRRGGRPLPLFSEVPLRRLRGDVPNLRAGEAATIRAPEVGEACRGRLCRWRGVGRQRKNRSRPFGRLPPPSKINPLYLF